MKILIINNETKSIDDLITLFGDDEVTVCRLGEDFDRQAYDLYVLSGGSHHSVFFEPSPYQKEIDFIRHTDKKVIGICLGCQIIAKAFDSTINKLEEKIDGIIDIEYNGTMYQVFEAHRYAIISLGDELCGLAQSTYGYEIIQHIHKPIRGFQFHPEKHMEFTAGRQLLQQVLSESE